MYLLTKSETLQTGVTISFTSGVDTGNIIDGDLTTGAETVHRNPNLTVDLGSRKVIDALYLKGENLLCHLFFLCLCLSITLCENLLLGLH